MEETFKILNLMVEEGAIGGYALCGAMAAFSYIEPFATQDLDVTAKMVTAGPLLNFGPITAFLKKHGIPVEWAGEGLYIGGYPVQFLPDSDPLDADALANAREAGPEGVRFRIWSMEHLMAKCLQVGRPKDQARLALFLDREYDKEAFCNLVQRFNLTDRWASYCSRTPHADVCRAASHP